MAVKLRLRRMGRKKRPVFSIVATDSRSPRDGRFIEDLGRYYAVEQPARVELKKDRILYWLENGAKPSDTVRSFLSDQGIMLTLHLRRKGKDAEEIQTQVDQFLAARAEKKSSAGPVLSRRAQALEDERKKAAKAEAEEAKARAEAEEKAKQEAEEAKRAAAEKRLEEKAAAAEVAREEQAEANAAQEAADAAPETTEAAVEEAAPEATEAASEAAAEEVAAEAAPEEAAESEAPAVEEEAAPETESKSDDGETEEKEG